MGAELQWAWSGGGPLIAIDAALAAIWRGTLPPIDTLVPDGWTWGDDGGVRCDYDRACDDMDDVITTGDLVHACSIPVGPGRALVLDGEIATTGLVVDGDIVLIRNAPDGLDAAMATALAHVVPWEQSVHELELGSGALLVFDAAAPSDSDPSRIDANGLVRVDAAAGKYRAWFAASGPPSSDPAVLIRLSRSMPAGD